MNFDIMIFFALVATTIIPAVLVITTEDIFKAALALLVMFISISAIYISLGAEFLAAVQILVYGGAVTILIIFGIMLTNRTNTGGEENE